MRNDNRPCAVCAERLEAARHEVRVLELEKARAKLKAKTLAVRLERAERLLKQAREARHVQ